LIRRFEKSWHECCHEPHADVVLQFSELQPASARTAGGARASQPRQFAFLPIRQLNPWGNSPLRAHM